MGLFDKLKSTFAPREEPVPTHVTQSFMHEEGNGSSWNDAPFDFENEPETWFIAERRLEHVFEDPAGFQSLALEYGVEDAEHFLRLRESWTHFQHALAQTQGQDAVNDLLQRGLNAETIFLQDQDRATVEASNPGLLEPIEGFSLLDYGRIVARMAAGEDLDKLVREFGMDRAKYDRVSEAWNQRMAEDTTFTIANEYGKAFLPASNEARGTADGPAFSWEQCIEATNAMSSGTAAGMDPQVVLKQLGMTLSDYVNASNHWSTWFNQNAIRDPAILTQFNELDAKYAAKYALAKNDQDLTF